MTKEKLQEIIEAFERAYILSENHLFMAEDMGDIPSFRYEQGYTDALDYVMSALRSHLEKMD